VKGERNVTDTLRRRRRELWFSRYQARTDNAAIAVLEIVSR
jgi:hypothetical protein